MSTEIIEAQQTAVAAPQDASFALISVIERVALNPDVDVTKLQQVLDMQERIFNRRAEQAFNASMAVAQSEMGRVSTDAENPQTRSKYASYAAIDRAVRPIYTKHGFALSFNTEPALENCVRVVCLVSHRDGHCRRYAADMPSDGLGAKGGAVMTKTHAAGSAMSYGQRYLLKLIFNVAIGDEDDDGNGGVTDEMMLDWKAAVEGAETMDALTKLRNEGVAFFKRADDYRAFMGFVQARVKALKKESAHA